MQHERKGLDGAELIDPEGIDIGDPRKIVSQQVDDHDIFRTILGRGLQFVCQFPIASWVAGTTASSFDGTSLDPALLDSEESFRRCTDDLSNAHIEERCKRSGVDASELSIQRLGVAAGRAEQSLRQVDLEDVSGVDVLDGFMYRVAITVAIEIPKPSTTESRFKLRSCEAVGHGLEISADFRAFDGL